MSTEFIDSNIRSNRVQSALLISAMVCMLALIGMFLGGLVRRRHRDRAVLDRDCVWAGDHAADRSADVPGGANSTPVLASAV